MARSCTVCVRKDFKSIEAALQSGSSMVSVARAHHCAIESLRRCRTNHMQKSPKSLQPVVPGLGRGEVERVRGADSAPEAAAISLRSPSDVLGALESTFGEALGLLDRSKAAGDLRLQNQLLNTLVVTLDKLAKSVGLYSDAPIVNVDASTRKIEVAFKNMSDDEVLAYMRANGPPIEAA